MKILVSSINPVKINSAKEAFKKMFQNEPIHVDGISFPSGVNDQPMSDEETLNGAKNRAKNAQKEKGNYDFYVGIEGGLDEKNGEMEVLAWVYIISKEGKIGKGKSAAFYLPKKMVDLIHKGKELGEVDDIVFGRVNSKQKDGTVGALTKGAINRTDYYIQAVILALIPFINPELY